MLYQAIDHLEDSLLACPESIDPVSNNAGSSSNNDFQVKMESVRANKRAIQKANLLLLTLCERRSRAG